MNSFEYVMVIIAIIMGLGITTLLRGIVNAMRADSPQALGLVHGLWVANMLMAITSLWAIRWNGDQRQDWPVHILMLFLLLPIIYYAQAELLFPRENHRINLTEYFVKNRRPFFSLALVGVGTAAVSPYLFYGGSPFTLQQSLFLYVPLVAVHLLAMSSVSVRLHGVLAAFYLVFGLLTFGYLDLGVG